MKPVIVSLIGDPIDNLYQLGLRERDSFLKIEKRVTKLLSTNFLLRFGQDVITLARTILIRREESFFDKCIKSYSEGLGIDASRYMSFLSLFDLAAQYGQAYPELKGILPGCSSIFSKTEEGHVHTRLLDFPLIGLFEEAPRVYFWQPQGLAPIISFSSEGLAPLFFQGIHGNGISFALHHKPGNSMHRDGQSIFQIAFETLFKAEHLSDFKREMKKKTSVTKWAFLLLEKSGQALEMDIDGPTQKIETYNINDTSPLIFTNIPLQNDSSAFESYIKFSEIRQSWLKEKLRGQDKQNILDLVTDVEDQKIKSWLHPGSTLSTVGAYSVNLTNGFIDIKVGQSALVKSDAIYRISLSNHLDINALKEKSSSSEFEKAWKLMARAQSSFDQGAYETAYHELQIAISTMPHPVWREILSFYLCIWDFKFVENNKELALIYKKIKMINAPPPLKDQWMLFIMRFEKRLDLLPTVNAKDISPHLQPLFQQEKLAARPLFATWMKLLYPRLEILDIFSPHQK